MMWFWWISGVVVGGLWAWHVVEGGLGMRRVARIDRPEWDRAPVEPAPSVSLIVPALNEERTIEPALRSLMTIDYPNYKVIAVNDRSEDATGEIMERVAAESNGRMRVIQISELPARWLGKTHAMWRAAQESRAEWLLFTDADVVFRGDALRRAVAYAESERADHLVLFPTMEFKTFGEKMVLAFFSIMFAFGQKAWKVADPKTKDHVGMGAFNMVRRSVYEAIGTYERMRLAVIDDIKLGEVIKHSGYRQRVAMGYELLSIHWAPGAFGILHGLTKNLFAQLRFNMFFAVVASSAMLFVNLMPFVGVALAPGWAKAPFGLGLLVLLMIYASFRKTAPGIPWWMIVMHPVATVLMAYAVARSTFVTLKNGGITWRGTKYSLEELREGMR